MGGGLDDVTIRRLTDGQQTLDDFCRLFAGPDSPDSPYDLEEILATLRSVAPYDWRRFFNQRVSRVRPEAPVEGLELAGWRLVRGDERSEYHALAEDDGYRYLFRIGLTINDEGEIDDVFAGSPADAAGLVPGSRVVAVNALRFKPFRLLWAIGKTHLILEHEDLFWITQLEVPEGGDFPALERIEDRPDLLADILEPRRSSSGTE